MSCRYAENQDLVNQNAALVQQQAETIAQLRSKLEQPGAGAGASSKALQAANKRVKEREAELEEVKVKGSLATMLQCSHLLPHPPQVGQLCTKLMYVVLRKYAPAFSCRPHQPLHP